MAAKYNHNNVEMAMLSKSYTFAVKLTKAMETARICKETKEILQQETTVDPAFASISKVGRKSTSG
jgi:hypothetical protein